MKYRKRALVVEATQWWKAGDHAAVAYPVPSDVPIPTDALAILVAQYQHPDKIVRIDGVLGSKLHLHEQGA